MKKRIFAILLAGMLAVQLAPMSVSAASTASTDETLASSQTEEKKFDPFRIPTYGNYQLYIYKPAFMMYVDMGNARTSKELPTDHPLRVAIKTIRSLKGTPTGQIPEDANIESGFMYVANDGSNDRYQYLLQGGMLVVDDVAYKVTQEQYKALLDITKTDSKELGIQAAQWLVYMDPSRVVKIETRDANRVMRETKKENIPYAAMEPRFIPVSNGTTYTAGAYDFTTMFRTVFTFDKEGGITYTIATSSGKLYVESSDMRFGCMYDVKNKDLNSFIRTMRGMIDGPANPHTI